MTTRSFDTTLKKNNLLLCRENTTTLQINVGYLCNLQCKHCHVEGGPHRTEVMTKQTMEQIITFAEKNSFSQIDITGGAPEMVEDLEFLISNLRQLTDSLLFRSNLTLLFNEEYSSLVDSIIENRIGLVVSFPSSNKTQLDSQRGAGVHQKSLDNLLKLNKLGFGIEGTGLELYLVSNPTGAFMPVDQCTAEKKFRKDLANKWGIHFTGLFTFANVPLGRFKKWLIKSGNYENYITKLANNFNSDTVQNLMCRSLISISWDGYLYDCDFNQAISLPHLNKKIHISQIDKITTGEPIMTDVHCYGCTAGAGFT